MDIKINITYKKIKNIHLRVKNGEAYVSAPFFTSKDFIYRFVNDNMSFIEKQLNKQQEKSNNDFSINDKISILNNTYQILETSSKKIKVTDHFIFLNKDFELKKQIKLLFKEKLYVYMYELTKKYFDLMNINTPFPKIIIKDVKSKWGSYNKLKHEIIYSSNVVFKDISLYDYLVVHELAHILQFNHSKKFYEIVSKYCPNYKKLRKSLKEV